MVGPEIMPWKYMILDPRNKEINFKLDRYVSPNIFADGEQGIKSTDNAVTSD